MIFILVPVYNEALNLGNLHRELGSIQFNDSVHFVFSDDGSTDESKKIISTLFSHTTFTVLGDGINRGPGA
ncbi:MAG TPA: glycosyltransferase, partial [Cyclobacteriaceae bacterium]|nr:glycosyltransferase [Cyclobacteriaceae bacterium]